MLHESPCFWTKLSTISFLNFCISEEFIGRWRSDVVTFSQSFSKKTNKHHSAKLFRTLENCNIKLFPFVSNLNVQWSKMLNIYSFRSMAKLITCWRFREKWQLCIHYLTECTFNVLSDEPKFIEIGYTKIDFIPHSLLDKTRKKT